MAISCRVCNLNLSGPVDYQAHIAGRRHKQKVQSTAFAQNTQNTPSAPQPQPTRSRGQVGLPAPGASANGQRSTRPRANPPRGGARPQRGTSRPAPPPTRTILQQPQPDPADLPDPEEDIPIKRPYLIDFGVILKLEEEHIDPKVSELEIDCSQYHDFENLPTTLQINITPAKKSRKLSAQAFKVLRQTKLSPGRFQLQVEFNPNDLRTEFKAIIGAPEDHKQLKPIARFTRAKKNSFLDNWHRGRMLRGKPTVSNPDFKKLGAYDIPHPYRHQFDVEVSRCSPAELEIYMRSLLPTPLDINTYAEHWTHLLRFEELQIERDLKMYDMKNVAIRQVPDSSLDYSLNVPGLLEKRPSLIVTDMVAIKGLGITYSGPVYGGYVKDVQMSTVVLRMHEDFPGLDNERWDVRFTVNRLLLRRMHDSVNKFKTHERILFPSISHRMPSVRSIHATIRLDRRVAENEKQSLAVRQILGQPAGDVPFILFGPPGTGKTTALIEAIHQVITLNPDSRVLVCAPSNTATDLIALRLAKTHSKTQLLRLNAPARKYDTLPTELRDFSCAEGTTFKSPPKSELQGYRIIASTCYYASVPQAMGITNHFTHIFVDEAGHATEPEVMVAVLQNASPDTNVIICGDPMQLGPIVQSKECGKVGMEISFLDRLMKLPVYEHGDQSESDPRIVKLLQNYRNHPAILKFPNGAFYKSELAACADPRLSKSLEQFSLLPKKGFPIIFHSICGENLQEAKSPSYFNISEVTLVGHYVQKLLSSRRLGLKAQDIGVISPYRQQCAKITQLLRREKHGGVDVKVTEDWQGQERRVIIVSTVRSQAEVDEEELEDVPKFLGFMANWRRTNVMITRAQALLIVIGNAETLGLDPTWHYFMRYVYASGGWIGENIPFSPTPTPHRYVSSDPPERHYEQFDAQAWEDMMNASLPF
ncbi:RNA helicase [Ceratobasidium sp. AG-Ba]|nr:RNA helicase [Ceratobasidium sp. AG-Ba]